MKKATEIRNFVVAGHGGSGKTSLCELMLFKGGAIERVGSVDKKNSVSDYTPDEQDKLSSIYSTAMHCSWKDNELFFLDTPGYGEFVGETIGAMSAVDNALVVLDAIDGPLMGTARGWKFSRLRGIPRFGLINRLDKERADFKRVLEQMRHNHGKTVVIPLTCPDGNEGNFTRVYNVLFDKDIPAQIASDVAEYRELLLDAIAETDEGLMERYLAGEVLNDDEIFTGLRKAVLSCRIIPVFAGSVAKDIGITELMDAMNTLFADPLHQGSITLADDSKMPIKADGPGVAQVFKTINDPFIGQLTFFRVWSGSFKADSEIFNLNSSVRERFGNIFLMNGKNQSVVHEVCTGMIAAVAKMKDSHIGNTLSSVGDGKPMKDIAFPNCTMSYAISAAKSGEDEKVATALHKISECDPTIKMSYQNETHETLISGMGDLHLSLAQRKMRDVYKAEALFATPKIPYRETITGAGEGHYKHKKQSGGAGQFAEVYLKIAYNEPGYEFSNEVVGGSIPKNFIPAVEKGIQETMNKGPLVGCHVERVKVTVYDGKYHAVDSNEMSFKIAARMAFKDAMAKAHPVLLEPIMKVAIHIPDNYMGDITGDLNHRRGRIIGMGMEEGMEVVNAEVPMAEMSKYATELRSITQGRGSFAISFARYEQVPPVLANEIIAKHQSEQKEEE